MERTFDSLPPKFEVSKRHWVVAVGQVVRRTLRDQLGVEPSNDLIKSIVEEKREDPAAEQVLFQEANRNILSEFQEEVRKIAKGRPVDREYRRRAKNKIVRRYQEIEADFGRNYSFLDSLLITD